MIMKIVEVFAYIVNGILAMIGLFAVCSLIMCVLWRSKR